MERLKDVTADEGLTYIIAGDENADESNPTNHDFRIYRTTDDKMVGFLHFQQGGLSEEGVNGVLNEDLLTILIDRVESFQRSKLRCRENENALQHLYEARWWLYLRHNKNK